MQQIHSEKEDYLSFFIFLIGMMASSWIVMHLHLPEELHPVLFFSTCLVALYLFNYFKLRFNCMVSTGPDGYRIKSLRKRVPKDQKTKYFLWEDLRHYYVDKMPKGGDRLHLFTNSSEETIFEDVNMRRFHNYLKLNFPEKNSGEA